MMNWMNKYTALLVLLLILIIAYFFVWRSSGKGSKKGGKKKKSKKKTRKGRRGRAGKGRAAASDDDSEPDEEDEDDDVADASGDDDDEEGDKLREDAEELYNLVHEGLCKGMQQDDFEELAGDIAGDISFIELKQMYNQCTDRKMDPMKVITIEDYVRVLKKEDG